MSEYFIFGGVDCRSYGVAAFEGQTFGGPARSYEVLTIPSRDGGVLIDSKRTNNTQISYACVIPSSGADRVDDFRNALLSKLGYNRLEDSIHPLEYYQAVIMSDFTPVLDERRKMAKFTVTFTRKPQRFLKSGESSVTFSGSGSIYNPTLFPSKPLVRVYGNGTVTMGGTTITISGVSSSYVDIDCEVMEAYTGATNQNSHVRFSTNDFPTLAPGTNSISKSGPSSVVITPRWYKM